MRTCNHKNCTKEAIECYLEDGIEFLCPTHAKQDGYCPGCGYFYDGTNQFLLNDGWCDNCKSEIDSDEENEPDWHELFPDNWESEF